LAACCSGGDKNQTLKFDKANWGSKDDLAIS
jgi:hypothetical protein